MVFLPPLRPGVNLSHLARLHALVGLTDAQPVLLDFGWTSLLMGSTRAEILIPVNLIQLPNTAPLVITIFGLDWGIPLSDLLYKQFGWTLRTLRGISSA